MVCGANAMLMALNKKIDENKKKFKVKCAYCKKVIYERAPSEADEKLVVFCSEDCLFNYKYDRYWKNYKRVK